MDCIITIPARGDLKKEKTGPISSFIRDLSAYYTAIFDHCKTCTKCDPNEILRGFLKNRENAEKRGYTSAILVKLAVKFLRGVPGTDPDVAREFLMRTSSYQTLLVNLGVLSSDEVLRILRNIYDDRRSNLSRGYRVSGTELPFDSFIRESKTKIKDHKELLKSEKFLFVHNAMLAFNTAIGIPEDNQEAMDLISVAEVMIS